MSCRGERRGAGRRGCSPGSTEPRRATARVSADALGLEASQSHVEAREASWSLVERREASWSIVESRGGS